MTADRPGRHHEGTSNAQIRCTLARQLACLSHHSHLAIGRCTWRPCNSGSTMSLVTNRRYAAPSLQIPSVPAAGKRVTSSTSRRSIITAGRSQRPALSSCSVAGFWKLMIRYNETRGFTDRFIRTVLHTYGKQYINFFKRVMRSQPGTARAALASSQLSLSANVVSMDEQMKNSLYSRASVSHPPSNSKANTSVGSMYIILFLSVLVASAGIQQFHRHSSRPVATS